MRVVKFIPIKNITANSHSISPETFDLAKKLDKGTITPEDLPPIKVQLVGARYYLKDGRHRFTAFKLLGYEYIKAKFFKEEKEKEKIQ